MQLAYRLLALWRRRLRLTRAAAEQLSAFLQRERAAIVQRWRRELRLEALAPADFDTALAPLPDELARILVDSDDAAAVFAERLAGRGAARYRERARLRDAEREVGLLARAVICTWRRHGELPIDVALLLDAVVQEAVVRVSRDYARASEAAEARARLAAVMRALERLSEVAMVLDRRGAIAMVVGPVEQLLGRTPDEMIGQPGRGPAREALRSGREVRPERVRVRNARTGDERTCETRAFPLREPGQSDYVVGAVELLRDVTVELLHDEELRRADRELTALHGRLLRRAHGQAMAELATSIASQLNNELNAMSMSLALVHKELATPSDAVARHLDAVEQGVQRSATQLARLQQLAARAPTAPPRAVALNQVLMEALDLVRPELTTSATRKAVRVDARLGETPPVVAQASELRELICSLLLEARDAMAPGGVLQAATRPERDGASLLLTHPEPADGSEAVEERAERGVTLAAARERARRWGGELVAERRGGALTLRLTLPAAPAVRPSPSGTQRVARPARRVLVVDDDAGNRETLSELLALSGHEVRGADSGTAALQAVASAPRPFDVALVDLAMPDMNGVELARRLRARDQALRIALVTGWDPNTVDGSDVVDAVFRKPIDLPKILEFLDGEADKQPERVV